MMSENYEKYFEVNKDTWNKKVAIHTQSKFYNNEAFLKGETSLNAYELDALGDVEGKKLLHLQCHFGQDTLSWSRLGAKCTGIDISDKGIEFAKELNRQLNLDATFIESNVYDVPENVPGKFDVVFTSYGVIGWLPDLDKWASVIAEKLVKGGTFYMVEFHPIVWMFDYLTTPPTITYPYKKGDVIYEEYEGTYSNTDAHITSKEYGWNHGLSEVINALLKAGLEIVACNDYDESPYDCLAEMKQTKSGMYVSSQFERIYPLIYDIKAVKK
jgi:SAM-dependent methyltransferase